ncbi:hypothetical protein PVA8_362 [Vibrio phage PVA8]|nr:hypothetical protein [Vibrio phage PC-Liy1]URQ03348.1 hypothetical protein PVA8_362 [Vibrio phage PVA8]WBM59081.1 hypothetical protein vBValMPVA8_359 [Vibrio phage vB_ValM_PVA8]
MISQELIRVIMFMRENNSNRAGYYNDETGEIHVVTRREDGFYIGRTKICEL